MKVLGYAKAVVWVTSKLSIIQKSIETLKAGIKAFKNLKLIGKFLFIKPRSNLPPGLIFAITGMLRVPTGLRKPSARKNPEGEKEVQRA